MNKQNLQDIKYNFPYHYIPIFENNNFKHLRGGAWYLEYMAFLEFLTKNLKNFTFESLLDIGCGDGRTLSHIYKEFSTKKLVGIDISENAIQLAKLLNRDKNIEFIQSNVKTIRNKYDILLLIEVLEHIYPNYRNEFLQKIRDLMHKNSVLIITVPHINRKLDPRHYNHFSVDTIIQSLDDHFDIKDVRYLAYKSPIVSFIYKLLENKFFMLNHQKILNLIFNYYSKKFLFAPNEKSCLRLYLEVKVK